MITVQTKINASIDKAWDFWRLPEHIVKWNSPSNDWYTSKAENDLTLGGKFKYTMNAKEQDLHFDFEGVYTKVEKNKVIEYKLHDNRTGSVQFLENDNQIILTETFEPTPSDPESMQQEWCQAVIDNFKKYVESFSK